MWKIVFIVVFVLAIGGMATFLLLPDQKILNRMNQNQNQIQDQNVPTTIPTQAPQPSPQAVDSNPLEGDSTYIKDALAKSTSLECDYTDAEGRQVKTYIKNGDVRSNYTSENPEDSAVTIIKDNKMYVWNTSTKEGYFMILNPAYGGDAQNNQATYNVVADLEKYKQFCKSATVADDLFIPPSDVKLDDYSQEGPDNQEPDAP